MEVQKSLFGKTSSGENVDLFSIKNDLGMSIKVSTFGATLTSIVCADKQGKLADVTLGFDSLDQYLAPHPFFGVICGRFANRIAKGTFILNDKKYSLAINNGPNSLHGGLKGFDKVVWKGEMFQTSEESGVRLTYISKDLEEGYPGNLTTEVTYTLNNKNEIKIMYGAESDAPTVINLTNHAYFNLNGCQQNVLQHVVAINADAYTEVDGDSTPSGNNPSVANSAFDFRKAKAIGEHIEKVGGYDHNFILNKPSGQTLSFAGSVYDPASGRTMDAFTTEPGMQFYTGNFLDGSLVNKNGVTINKHFGFCWETQHYPDSPNHPHFPSTVLNPGKNITN